MNYKISIILLCYVSTVKQRFAPYPSFSMGGFYQVRPLIRDVPKSWDVPKSSHFVKKIREEKGGCRQHGLGVSTLNFIAGEVDDNQQKRDDIPFKLTWIPQNRLCLDYPTTSPCLCQPPSSLPPLRGKDRMGGNPVAIPNSSFLHQSGTRCHGFIETKPCKLTTDHTESTETSEAKKSVSSVPSVVNNNLRIFLADKTRIGFGPWGEL